jgi:hypothetical protein
MCCFMYDIVEKVLTSTVKKKYYYVFWTRMTSANSREVALNVFRKLLTLSLHELSKFWSSIIWINYIKF